MTQMRFVLAPALLFCLAVGGCVYRGEGVDNPFERRASWFSFAAGDDIRAACRPGSPDRYRAIYNGFWRKQVRIYELGIAAPRRLDQRVLGPGSLVGVKLDDLLAPWRGTTAATELSQAQYDVLAAALAAAVQEPRPIGLRLPSDGFYWTVVGCADGRFAYNAWLFPSDRFEALGFPGILLADDRTREPFEEPSAFGYVDQYSQVQLAAERWFIEVGPNGLSPAGQF